MRYVKNARVENARVEMRECVAGVENAGVWKAEPILHSDTVLS